MRPLETQVEMSSHLWVFNRVKELLTREGLITRQASDDEVRSAVNNWTEMMSSASKEGGSLSH